MHLAARCPACGDVEVAPAAVCVVLGRPPAASGSPAPDAAAAPRGVPGPAGPPLRVTFTCPSCGTVRPAPPPAGQVLLLLAAAGARIVDDDAGRVPLQVRRAV